MPSDSSILDALNTDAPVGLGGCRLDRSFDSCEYNVTIFDDSNLPDDVIQINDNFIKVAHGSLNDSDSDVLVHYDSMRVLHDPSWELQMMLTRINSKRNRIFLDYAKNCIINSIFCCTKSKEGVDSDVFAACWQKSALVYLANSILAINHHKPSPSHNLETLRSLKKSSVTDKISIIHDSMGIERTTPSLLERMCKSTIGFSKQIEKNDHHSIIQAKHDYFIKNSMLTDCYFYLTCINHTNFISLKNSIHRKPDLIYILKVAFDLQNDSQKLLHDIDIIHKTCNEILSVLDTK